MAISKSLHEKTASAQLVTGRGLLYSVEVITDGSNDAVCNVYDVASSGDAAASTKLFEWTQTATGKQGGRDWMHPVQFTDGLYVTISGTGASYIVEWRKG